MFTNILEKILENYKSKVAIVYLLSFFTDLLNVYIATIAFPVMGRELHANISELAWVANIYAIGLALIIPVSGWLSDRFGTKRIFILSLVVFLLGIVMSGLSPNIEILIFWRFVQGLGGGLLIPIGQTITYRVYPLAERAKLTSLIMAVAAIAPAISPTVGGFIIEHFSWPWIFFFNIPLVGFTIFLSIIWLKDDSERNRTSIDLIGLVLVSSGLIVILYGLSRFSNLNDIPSSLMYLLGGFALLYWSILHLAKIKNPILKIQLIKDKYLAKASIIYIFIVGGFSGVNIINIYFFQEVLHVTAVKTGLLMVPYSVGIIIALTLSGHYFNRLGPRVILLTGLLINALGFISLIFVSSPQFYIFSLVSFFLIGVGGALCTSGAQVIAFIQIPNDKLSHASSLWNLNRQLCFSFGVAIFSMLLTISLNYFGLSLTNITNYKLVTSIFHAGFILAGVSIIIPFIMVHKINNNEVIQLINKN